MRISDWSSDVCSSELIQARIDGRVIGAFEVGLGQLPRATEALGDIFAGQFQVHATETGAGRGAEVERLLQFAADVRSEERRVGTECVRTGRFRWSPAL